MIKRIGEVGFKTTVVLVILLFVLLILCVLISVLFIGGLGVYGMGEYKDARDTAAALHAPTEQIELEGVSTSYKDVSENLSEANVSWNVDGLMKSVKWSSLYTINAQNDALVNVYAYRGYSGYSDAKVYVKNAALIPTSLDASYISDVSLYAISTSGNEDVRYNVELSEAQIQSIFDTYLYFENSNLDTVGTVQMDETEFSDKEFRFGFYIKGIDGLYFSIPLNACLNLNDNQYYWQFCAKEYILLPEDIQAVLKDAVGIEQAA